MNRFLAALALSAGFVGAAVAEDLSIKGYAPGVSVGEIKRKMPFLDCAPGAAPIDETCVGAGKVPEDLATYGGYSVTILGVQNDEGMVASITMTMKDAKLDVLRALLDKKYGPSTISGNPRATYRWERGGRRLSLGTYPDGGALVALWDVAAFERMVKARARQRTSDL